MSYIRSAKFRYFLVFYILHIEFPPKLSSLSNKTNVCLLSIKNSFAPTDHLTSGAILKTDDFTRVCFQHKPSGHREEGSFKKQNTKRKKLK